MSSADAMVAPGMPGMVLQGGGGGVYPPYVTLGTPYSTPGMSGGYLNDQALVTVGLGNLVPGSGGGGGSLGLVQAAAAQPSKKRSARVMVEERVLKGPSVFKVSSVVFLKTLLNGGGWGRG